MKLFVVVSALLVVANAGVIAPIAVPAIATTPLLRLAVPVGQHSSQYHSQDAFGQYAYGYSNELSAKNEIKSADGAIAGAYSYVDAEGKIQNVHYSADAIHGFRVAASNLPVAPSAPIAAPIVQVEPVKDTPEVAEAKAKHLETLRLAEEEAKKNHELAAIQLKSAIQAHPAVITSASPAPVAPSIELFRSAPLLAAPTFGYSFGINYGGLYAFQPHSFITAYSAPAPFLASSVVAQAAPVAAEQASPAAAEQASPAAGEQASPAAAEEASPAAAEQAAPEAPSDLPEVVEARAKHLEAVENIKKDIEAVQKDQAKE